MEGYNFVVYKGETSLQIAINMKRPHRAYISANEKYQYKLQNLLSIVVK